MTEPQKRHPFLDDLADDVVLSSSILRRAVRGRDQALKVVRAAAGQYLSQTPRFLGTVGTRSYFEYDVTLAGGLAAAGLVSIVRNADHEVTELLVAFSPLGSVLSLAAGVREQLAADLGADVFL